LDAKTQVALLGVMFAIFQFFLNQRRERFDLTLKITTEWRGDDLTKSKLYIYQTLADKVEEGKELNGVAFHDAHDALAGRGATPSF
jgi:hypothetical protein